MVQSVARQRIMRASHTSSGSIASPMRRHTKSHTYVRKTSKKMTKNSIRTD